MMARTMTAATDQASPSLFDKVFGLERHEYAAVVWSFLYFFCVLSAYYILRPVREMLGVQSGPDTLPYLFMASFTVMLIATPIFGWITCSYWQGSTTLARTQFDRSKLPRMMGIRKRAAN